MVKIISCVEIGEQDTYDLEIEHLDHQYYLANGVLTSNSHALCYSMITFQCAWLLTYYTEEWCCALLNNTKEEDKEEMINAVKGVGVNIISVDINRSGKEWTPSKEKMTIIAPLNSIKGLGDVAMNTILTHRPYPTIEELLFGEGKVNKTAISVLIRANGANSLMDDRFRHLRHFWLAVADDKPANPKKLNVNIEKYKGEKNFTPEEMVENAIALTGNFPWELVMNSTTRKRLEDQYISSIGKFEPGDEFVWFVPRIIEEAKTQYGNTFYRMTVLDVSGKMFKVKIFGVKPENTIYINRPYLARVEWDETYGFTIKSYGRDMRLLS